MNPPRLVVGDGHLGIWGALRNVWPDADQQRCWNHKILNVLDKLPRTQHVVAKSMLSAIAYATTEAKACEKGREFEAWCLRRGYTQAAETLSRDWERMLTFYRYPKEHWVDQATAVIWKMLMVVQKKFRRLNAPGLLTKVYAGVQYKDGIEVTREEAVA